mmetsp:Transcript_28710/g.57810  ORF Transcript_28710/g.57810 Transcript_28710/m.57810 type:complete len:112 (-) Transcript_28710:42-377(-)
MSYVTNIPNCDSYCIIKHGDGALIEKSGMMIGRQSSGVLKRAASRHLLSMRTVGSMDVERKIKPLKDTILTKDRNLLKDPKGVALYRLRENLNFIMKAKKELGKKVAGSLV